MLYLSTIRLRFNVPRKFSFFLGEKNIYEIMLFFIFSEQEFCVQFDYICSYRFIGTRVSPFGIIQTHAATAYQ